MTLNKQKRDEEGVDERDGSAGSKEQKRKG